MTISGKQTIKNIVHVMFALVGSEMAWKAYKEDPNYWLVGGSMFVVSYALCIVTDVLGASNLPLVKSSVFRGVLSILHGLDGLAALAIGVAIYQRSIILLFIAMLAMTKFFLIHLLNRMILANKKTDNLFDGLTQTTKSYLHHVASFIFLRHPLEIVITTVWRTISMSGHAALVLRDKLSTKSMRMCHWMLAYVRIAFQIFLVAACFSSATLRSQFAHSAVGHIAYMAVRLEPVFQQGSMYLTSDEKEEWVTLSAWEKIAHLAKGYHFWLALELVLLTTLVSTMVILRLQLLLLGELALVSAEDQHTGPLDSLSGQEGGEDVSQNYLRWFLGSLAQ